MLIREEDIRRRIPASRRSDAKGDTWFLEFDPPYFAEGATGAVAVATKIFWALGYNQVESLLTTFDPKNASTIDPKATMRAARPAPGHRFTQDDIERDPRAGARRSPTEHTASSPGGCCPARFSAASATTGTRPDDPNDIVPHEHRRELRALRVFGAWTNLTDLKAANTLDTLVDGERPHARQALPAGRRFDVRHVQRHARMGSELRALLPGRHHAEAPVLARVRAEPVADRRLRTSTPSIGKFEGDRVRSAKWRPQTPTTAYMEMRDDDAFWAARRVAAFTDELISAAVHTGRVQRPGGREVLGRRADQTPREDQEHLSDRGEPDRRPCASMRKPLDVRERGGRGRRRQRLGHVPRHRGCASTTRPARRTPLSETQSRPRPSKRLQASPDGRWKFRSGRHRGKHRRLPDLEAAGARLLPPGWRKLETSGARTATGKVENPAPARKRLVKARRDPIVSRRTSVVSAVNLMADTYRNFADLARHEKSGIDYDVLVRRARLEFAIVAPHGGGGIEPGTTETRRCNRGHGALVPTFEGLKSKVKRRSHITSTHFARADVPDAARSVFDRPDPAREHSEEDGEGVSRRRPDEALGTQIGQALTRKGFDVRKHRDRRLQGLEPNNPAIGELRTPASNWSSRRPCAETLFKSLTRKGRMETTPRFGLYSSARFGPGEVNRVRSESRTVPDPSAH